MMNVVIDCVESSTLLQKEILTLESVETVIKKNESQVSFDFFPLTWKVLAVLSAVIGFQCGYETKDTFVFVKEDIFNERNYYC